MNEFIVVWLVLGVIGLSKVTWDDRGCGYRWGDWVVVLLICFIVPPFAIYVAFTENDDG